MDLVYIFVDWESLGLLTLSSHATRLSLADPRTYLVFRDWISENLYQAMHSMQVEFCSISGTRAMRHALDLMVDELLQI